MEKQPMMKCGHRANATSNGKPCCVICADITAGYNEVAPEPDLSKRMCKCPQCDKIVPSTKAVAFFEHRPDKEYDTHYDGCRGWD
jgi:hypothetical protein